MPSFDSAKAYAAQETTFFDDGREIELLHYIYSRSDVESSLRNNPTAILAAIDEFARTKKYLMNVGEDKGKIVTDLIAEVKPKVMVELGGYIGYSTLLFASTVKNNGGTHYFSLERNPEFGAVIGSLIALAGLSSFVTISIGSSDASLARLHKSGDLSKIDMMFLDHYKPAYTSDLKLCEELGLVGVGSVLAADNVVKPGNPPYLEYVRSSVAEKKKKAAQEASEDGTDGKAPDERFADRAAKQYANRVAEEKVGVSKGRPELVYESRLVESFEPTGEPDGVEITKCVGEEK
ncbi:unnamed protein product [Zymoseptoria tritici ST99CH_1A5]|uniref:catechol O-methyltransferase n=3 Tax=Zymoseptoria tritici TaxID=1047171 RepID=A0A1X7RZW5_ZYMT9|nr:unnamed protein product [Zymoseptoria tritici ST99CH_3D7]SMR55310.1 unnamed protein product [Zymoseptoria tritici ST99CH_1E4]SMY26122.1 unnamed protein product [Zymoseptoria tritici ST99CH_1A5]